MRFEPPRSRALAGQGFQYPKSEGVSQGGKYLRTTVNNPLSEGAETLARKGIWGGQRDNAVFEVRQTPSGKGAFNQE